MPPNRKGFILGLIKTKNPLRSSDSEDFRGPERIRTAVQAFAELCLAARPQDHFALPLKIG